MANRASPNWKAKMRGSNYAEAIWQSRDIAFWDSNLGVSKTLFGEEVIGRSQSIWIVSEFCKIWFQNILAHKLRTMLRVIPRSLWQTSFDLGFQLWAEHVRCMHMGELQVFWMMVYLWIVIDWDYHIILNHVKSYWIKIKSFTVSPGALKLALFEVWGLWVFKCRICMFSLQGRAPSFVKSFWVAMACHVWNQPRRYDTVVWSASGKPGHPTRPVDASWRWFLPDIQMS